VLEDAEVLNVRNIAPWADGHDLALDRAADSLEEFGEQDVDRARQILEDEDAVGTEIRVETLDIKRRNDTISAIEEPCNEAGFDVKTNSTPNFFETEGNLSLGEFDVGLFAWMGSYDFSYCNSRYRTPRACDADSKGNNNGCYTDETMDEMLDQVVQEPDRDAALEIVADIEAQLWEDMVTIPLFQHPNITAWSEQVDNIVPNPTQTGVVWNLPEWTIPD
jgi:peptide/nickel transport system substrate-binding protein